MRHIRVILLVVLCGMGVALPVDVTSHGPEDEQADTSSSTQTQKPDLDTVINTIDGGSEIQKLAGMLKKFQIAKDGLQRLLPLSPLMKSMVDKAAKRNVELDVILKVMRGEMPDLHDVYRLATTKSNPIFTDINTVLNNSLQWKQFSELINDKTVMSSDDKVEKLIYLLTGKKVDVKSSLLKKLRTNRYTLSPTDDVAHVNMIQIMIFIVDNWHLLTVIGNDMTHDNPDYLNELQIIKKLDLSHLRRVLAPPQSLDSGHYAIASHWLGPTDPDVLQITKDLYTAPTLTDPQAKTKAEATVLDIVLRFYNIAAKGLEWVEAESKAPETTNPGSDETED